VADIQVQDVKTRVWYEDNTYVFDEAFWPQCGYEFPPDGGGSATSEVQSAIMGSKVNSVNLVFSEEGTAYIDVQTF
jgi:hypothetical protein